MELDSSGAAHTLVLERIPKLPHLPSVRGSETVLGAMSCAPTPAYVPLTEMRSLTRWKMEGPIMALWVIPALQQALVPWGALGEPLFVTTMPWGWFLGRQALRSDRVRSWLSTYCDLKPLLHRSDPGSLPPSLHRNCQNPHHLGLLPG